MRSGSVEHASSAGAREGLKCRPTLRWFATLFLALAVVVGGGFVIVQAPTLRAGQFSPSLWLSDADHDGLLDQVEVDGWYGENGYVFFSDPNKPDTDGDGLLDGEEAGDRVTVNGADAYRSWSDASEADSDHDGLGDSEEMDLALDAFSSDTDGDTLGDGQEVNDLETDPSAQDTDGDSFDDGYEVAHREDQGLDPLWTDEKVSKWQYAADFAQGVAFGDLMSKDSLAWLLGTIASSAAGPVSDVRDLVGSLIKADWVSAGLALTAFAPIGGDIVAALGKATKFVKRVPRLAPAVARYLGHVHWAPDWFKKQAAKEIWPDASKKLLREMDEPALSRLSGAGVDLKRLSDLREGSAALPRARRGAQMPAAMFRSWQAQETYVADLYRASSAKSVKTQVKFSLHGCTDVCARSLRRVDVLVDGVAQEVKTGFVRLSPHLRNQIEEDAYLIRMGKLKGAHYDFCARDSSSTLGASQEVLDLLREKGILFTIHLPRSAG